MKKIINEWKRFIAEGLKKTIEMELDLSTDSIILYHTGWMNPDDAFRNNADFVFSGEPEIFKDMTRPMGNDAIYFASNKTYASGYKRFSDLPYLYKVRFPISKIAGGSTDDPLRVTTRFEITLPKNQAEYFFQQASQNWNTDYKARFQLVGGGLEVAVYDASLIEILSYEKLFDENDVKNWFNKNIEPIFKDYMKPKRRPDGSYEILDELGDPMVLSKDDIIEYLEGDFEDFFVSTTHLPPKKREALEEFKRVFPTEYRSYTKSLLDTLASIKASK